jgi:hypothetical protein
VKKLVIDVSAEIPIPGELVDLSPADIAQAAIDAERWPAKLRAKKKATITRECKKRVEAIVGDTSEQQASVARMIRLERKDRVGTASVDEVVELNAKEALWDRVEAIRTARDTQIAQCDGLDLAALTAYDAEGW